MGFIHKNDGFICQNCGQSNPPAQKTCRNHCCRCLFSLHVDEKTPGDRQALCKGLMMPVAVGGNVDNLVLHHRCLTCGKTMKNKVAVDDDSEAVIAVMKKSPQL